MAFFHAGGANSAPINLLAGFGRPFEGRGERKGNGKKGRGRERKEKDGRDGRTPLFPDINFRLRP